MSERVRSYKLDEADTKEMIDLTMDDEDQQNHDLENLYDFFETAPQFIGLDKVDDMHHKLGVDFINEFQ